MTRFVEEKQVLKKFQFGFRKKTSTTDALIVFTEFHKMKIDQGFYNPTAFIDLSKAFNSINLDTLLKKLSLIGFDNFSCQLIESFLKDRRQRVSIYGQFSEWINLHQGVPQRIILGPLLFNLYVNDIDNFIEKDCH